MKTAGSGHREVYSFDASKARVLLHSPPSKNHFTDKQSTNVHRSQLFRDSWPGNHESPFETHLDPPHGKSRSHGNNIETLTARQLVVCRPVYNNRSIFLISGGRAWSASSSMNSFGSLIPKPLLEPPTAQWKECANLLHVKRRVHVTQFDHSHISKRRARQLAGGPHFAPAGCQPFDRNIGRVREPNQNVAERRNFLILILLQC